MKLYIKNLVNRLSQFSQKLDNIELFVDKKWVLIDDEGNQQTFIFERDRSLVMSINGLVKMGKWKHYPFANSIMIDRITDQILLNQAFFDNAVMILKYDGSPDKELFTLADANVIPDLDVKKYLQSVFNKTFNITTLNLEDGRVFEIYRGEENYILKGMKVSIDSEIPENGKYKLTDTNVIYELKNGKILDMTFLQKYKCSNGISIEIEQQYYNGIEIGNHVYIDKELAPTGKYKLAFMHNLKVEDGIIVKISIW